MNSIFCPVKSKCKEDRVTKAHGVHGKYALL